MKRFFILLCFGLCPLVFLTAQQNDLQTVAIVRLTKSEPITVKQFRTEVERVQKTSGRTLTAAQRRQVLDSMINERLAIQAAERDRVTVAEAELTQQIQEMRNNMAQSIGRPPSDAEFAQAILSQTGLDINAFREQTRKQFLVQKYLMSKKQSVFQTLQQPTDVEVQNYYELSKAQMVRPQTVRLSMIQIAFGEDAAARTRARDLANRLFQEVGTSPAKFDEVSLRAQSPNSGYEAGDAGYIPRNLQTQQVVGQAFLDIAFNLKQGEVSRLIEGVRGFQIIKITETYDQKNLELDDIYQLGTRITVREYIRRGLLQEREQEVLTKATQELIAELRTGNPFQIFENYLNF
jgi:parvulin-like peptidyl-prolyl isomerase